MIVRTIYNTDNILMIFTQLQFIKQFLSSILNDILRKQVVQEFYDTTVNTKKLDDIFKMIKTRIKGNKFKIENCTYEQCQKRIREF